MPKKLHKSLQICLSKLKKPSPRIQFPSNPCPSAGKLLSGCRHPKTLSFAIYRKDPSAGKCLQDPDGAAASAAILSDIDRILFEDLKSLYPDDRDGGEDSRPPAKPNRFFISTGPSSSLVEEASRMSSTTSSSDDSATAPPPTKITCEDEEEAAVRVPEDCVAVLTYSPDPYHDFKGSMKEVIELRFQKGATVDWEFMEELLFCYLDLNDKRSYKFILCAFVDLVVILRQSSNRVPTAAAAAGRSYREIHGAGERRKKKMHDVVVT